VYQDGKGESKRARKELVVTAPGKVEKGNGLRKRGTPGKKKKGVIKEIESY